MKNLFGWLFVILSPVALVTAVLSLLHSGDTFANTPLFLSFGILNLVLFVFYLKVGRALKTGKEWASKWLFISLPLAIIVLFMSYFLIFSLFI